MVLNFDDSPRSAYTSALYSNSLSNKLPTVDPVTDMQKSYLNFLENINYRNCVACLMAYTTIYEKMSQKG